MEKMTFNQCDKKSLFKDLQSAIEGDKRYWIENDAKIKAITTVNSYDEFKESVAAAHLKPVTRDDKLKKSEKNWNNLARPSINE